MRTILVTCDNDIIFCGLPHKNKHLIGAIVDSDTLEPLHRCIFIHKEKGVFSAFSLDNEQQECLGELSVVFSSKVDFAWSFSATTVLKQHLKKYATYTFGGVGLVKNCIPLYYRGRL